MRIWRIELGIWISEDTWTTAPWFEYLDASMLCGCRIYSFKKFYLTWLGKQCYLALKEKGNDQKTRKQREP